MQEIPTMEEISSHPAFQAFNHQQRLNEQNMAMQQVVQQQAQTSPFPQGVGGLLGGLAGGLGAVPIQSAAKTKYMMEAEYHACKRIETNREVQRFREKQYPKNRLKVYRINQELNGLETMEPLDELRYEVAEWLNN